MTAGIEIVIAYVYIMYMPIRPSSFSSLSIPSILITSIMNTIHKYLETRNVKKEVPVSKFKIEDPKKKSRSFDPILEVMKPIYGSYQVSFKGDDVSSFISFDQQFSNGDKLFWMMTNDCPFSSRYFRGVNENKKICIRLLVYAYGRKVLKFFDDYDSLNMYFDGMITCDYVIDENPDMDNCNVN